MPRKTKLSVDEYIAALEKMKKSPKDRIGILGKLGATGIGAAGGFAVSGPVAATFGATTLFGSTWLAAKFGWLVVVTTPVSWIIGTATLGGVVAYGIARLIYSGGKSDAIKRMNMRDLESRITQLKRQSKRRRGNAKMVRVIECVQLLVKNKKITQSESTDLLAGIEKGNIPADFVFSKWQEMQNTKRK